MPEVILWDLMDTLVHDPFFTHMAGFFGLTHEQLLQTKHKTAWRDFELGTLSEADLYRSFFRDGRRIDGAGLKRCMHDGYAWIVGMEALVSDLHRAGLEMHLVSNYPHWYELVDARVGFSRFVKPSFVSCHTGVRKPDPEAYLGACRALNKAPAQCLFIDDREVNCRAAQALGMPAVRFEGDVASLRQTLITRGLPA
jgi:FMN hydrolase / 5-amino-6-(5-phospho-D-ribitylamino)uracil phosphatase